MSNRVVSAKVPADLVAALDSRAAAEGVTRNTLVRTALEDLVQGRSELSTQEERLHRAISQRLAEERAPRDEVEAFVHLDGPVAAAVERVRAALRGVAD